LDLPEIQSLDLTAVIAKKAEMAYMNSDGASVLVEDTGLYVDCWNGLPGPLVRWFEETVGPAGICCMLSSFPHRAARAQTLVATFDGSLRVFSGEIRGTIADSPRGEHGFGWDTIFVPEGEVRTLAEMDPWEKDSISMRSKAFRNFAAAERNEQ
jgi:non-canonical purine NTP pyrophosphatase (RdgB/HAM1 family)